jgi:hypothetical protein
MACSLLDHPGMMWLAVGAASERGSGLEHLLLELASITRFTNELEQRLAGAGLGGLGRVRELHRSVVELLAAVSPDVARARATVAELVAALRGMEDALASLRRLKSELGRAS